MRINQEGLKKCKTGLHKCEDSSANRSCTQPCRYNKFIKIGMTTQHVQGMRTKDNDEAFLGPRLRRSVIKEVPVHSGSNNGAEVSLNGEPFVRPGLRRSVIQYVPGHSANTVSIVDGKTTGATNNVTTGQEVWVPGFNGGSNEGAEFCFKFIRPADQNRLGDNMDNVENVTLARESGVIRELEDNWYMDMDNYDFDIPDDLPDIK